MTPPARPDDPSEPARERRPRLSGTTARYLVRRVLAEFTRHGGTDQAAKLTYFMVLSVAPTLLAVFSLATLLLHGIQDQISALIKDAIARSGAAGEELDLGSLVDTTLDALLGSTTGGTVALLIGIGTALWSASAYVKAYSRASNAMYEVPEGRGPLRMNGTMLALTAALVLGILLIAVSLLLSDGIVQALLGPIAEPIGAGGLLAFLTDQFLPIWAWLRYPVVVVLLFVLVSLLNWGTPNIATPFRLVSPGGVFAVLGIGLAIAALSVYMARFASYSSYGAIGSIMAVLFALWVINTVLLLGAHVDVEYDRALRLEAGKPAEDALDLPQRARGAAEKAEQKYEALVDEGRDIRLRNLHRNSDAYTAPELRLEPHQGPASDREG
ncbi:YihY/virulence factor BrkB family protein [Brachybacterium hainanense]|uniref:YihY/virulence factor BrkB family protein n=1 Tax=Brachybacterium hainanense TaxID=1541174 RepID=A0ABV6RBZ2_9MICO